MKNYIVMEYSKKLLTGIELIKLIALSH